MALTGTVFAEEKAAAGRKQNIMNTIYLNESTGALPPSVATIGFFDGVHRGHQFLIRHVADEAQAAGMASMVITFDRHPRQVLQQDYQPELLSTLDSKLLLLSRTGVDTCCVLPFTVELARLSAREFMRQVLRDRLNVRKLVIGYDNRFGHDRREGFEEYVAHGRELGIEVLKNISFSLHGVNVSSSVVRSYISEGEVEMANACLGYPYTIAGRVVSGYRQGRELGYPTANLDTAGYGQMLPASGVYAVKVRTENSLVWRRAMMNIGTRPTFEGREQTLEVHIFHFADMIYGERLLVAFMHRIRAERKFKSINDLVAQLRIDAKLVDEQFDKDNEQE